LIDLEVLAVSWHQLSRRLESVAIDPAPAEERLLRLPGVAIEMAGQLLDRAGLHRCADRPIEASVAPTPYTRLLRQRVARKNTERR
jgi:hypothetical protein